MTTSNTGFATAEEFAATQYGTRAARPTTALSAARVSHHETFRNRPHVATVKPPIVAAARTPVAAQAEPDVLTSDAANIGVTHRNVEPNKNMVTPPRLRMPNIAAFLRHGLSGRTVVILSATRSEVTEAKVPGGAEGFECSSAWALTDLHRVVLNRWPVSASLAGPTFRHKGDVRPRTKGLGPRALMPLRQAKRAGQLTRPFQLAPMKVPAEPYEWFRGKQGYGYKGWYRRHGGGWRQRVGTGSEPLIGVGL